MWIVGVDVFVVPVDRPVRSAAEKVLRNGLDSQTEAGWASNGCSVSEAPP